MVWLSQTLRRFAMAGQFSGARARTILHRSNRVAGIRRWRRAGAFPIRAGRPTRGSVARPVHSASFQWRRSDRSGFDFP